MDRAVVLCAAAALAAAACGGKIAPLDTDAGDAGDAGADADDSGPFVTRVIPDHGPNCGGTDVVVEGYGFVAGRSDVTFATFPATGSCSSSTRCTAVSAFAGYQDFDQAVHVQVTVPTSSGDAGTLTSPATPLDVFTYTAGPHCALTLSCADRQYFPDMVITCPTVVTFYSQYLHNLSAVTRAATFQTGTEDFPIAVVACFGDSTTTSCATYVSVSSPFVCYGGDVCAYCKQLGGTCSGGSNPTCTR
jgi:hypothetical protein